MDNYNQLLKEIVTISSDHNFKIDDQSITKEKIMIILRDYFSKHPNPEISTEQNINALYDEFIQSIPKPNSQHGKGRKYKMIRGGTLGYKITKLLAGFLLT